ncbi:MAG: dihydrofolate reductase, partial [Myxococcota bacterium]|nr:dihydrofolate reductase [Myxococcota bacterium]
MRSFAIVVAADEGWGIGKDGDLAWHLPGDMRWFREITTGKRTDDVLNTVIMGRKTWDSIPPRFRPLPDRHNVVVSRNRNLVLPDGTSLVH